MNHTPGPWQLKPAPRNVNAIATLYAGTTTIADMIAGPLERDTRMADARLIESAPALADALAWALDLIEDDLDPMHQQALAHARAVLAQATGAES